MKRIIVMILLGVVLIYGTWHYFATSTSYVLAREGMLEYDQGNYARAHELLDQAVQADNYNRNAIVMRRNAYFALTTERASDSVEEVLRRVDTVIDQGEINQAIELAQISLKVLQEVSKKGLGNLERVEHLALLANQKIELAKKRAPDVYRQEARRYYHRDDWRMAFSVLGKIEEPDETTRLLRSELAYKIASADLEHVLEQATVTDIEPHQIRSLVDWFDQVIPASPYYREAQELKHKLLNVLQGAAHE
ncbi:hypothetical protein [Chrysiogenes arsenatis]|uniref:hypothetical protein n=1 Tax=Chrysiogenes arsenatis TaxID=309797 RepID=UPI000414B1BF|nr:hypothetical protein [Chrysiogenes arsenatis]